MKVKRLWWRQRNMFGARKKERLCGCWSSNLLFNLCNWRLDSNIESKSLNNKWSLKLKLWPFWLSQILMMKISLVSKIFLFILIALILTIHQTRFKTPSAVLEIGSNQSCFTFPLRKSKRHKVGNDCHCPLFEFFWLKLQLTSSLKNWEIWDILNKNSLRPVSKAQTC